MRDKLRVALVYGGESVEHTVSCRSSATICRNLLSLGHTVIPIGISRDGRWSVQECDLENPADPLVRFNESKEVCIRPGKGLHLMATGEELGIDVVFPVTHGTNGEDGRLQGLLDLGRIAYVGCGCTASSNGMHKYFSKILAREVGVPTLPAMVLDKRRIDLIQDSEDPYLGHLVQEIAHKLANHIVVKPEDGGSSIGISVVYPITPRNLLKAMQETGRYSQNIMLEPWIDHVQELEVAVLTDGDAIEASDPGLLIDPMREHEHITTYKQKYLASDCAYIQIPAPIPAETATQISQYAIAVAKSIGIEGFARVDFFQDPSNGAIYFNEINTLPGMTGKSHFPLLANSIGYDWNRLLRTLIQEGLSSHQRKHACNTVAVE